MDLTNAKVTVGAVDANDETTVTIVKTQDVTRVFNTQQVKKNIADLQNQIAALQTRLDNAQAILDLATAKPVETPPVK
jgi:NADH/NAD ratio-sensing transcriptional regulator Rex